MSDLHSINEAINKRAGRKLLPSILVSLGILLLVWLSLSTYRVLFAVLVTFAVVLGIREINRAFTAVDIHIPLWSLTTASIALCASTWLGGVSGLAVATAISFPALLVLLLPRGTENFVKTASASALALIYLPFLAGFLILLARPSNGLERVMTFVILVSCNDTFAYLTGVLLESIRLRQRSAPRRLLKAPSVHSSSPSLVAHLLSTTSWALIGG